MDVATREQSLSIAVAQLNSMLLPSEEDDYTAEELLRIRRQILREIFADMAECLNNG